MVDSSELRRSDNDPFSTLLSSSDLILFRYAVLLIDVLVHEQATLWPRTWTRASAAVTLARVLAAPSPPSLQLPPSSHLSRRDSQSTSTSDESGSYTCHLPLYYRKTGVKDPLLRASDFDPCNTTSSPAPARVLRVLVLLTCHCV